MLKKLTIATRNSPLAMAQANFLKEELYAIYPNIEVIIMGMTTKGDQILSKKLDKIGGKGLFIKELEQALQDNVADIAIHSLKDVPINSDPKITILPILKREDASDALISNRYTSLDLMPPNAIIGTASSRRAMFLQQLYPQLQVKLLRGNLHTRLTKLKNGEYDAIILAMAGLKRLNLLEVVSEILPITQFIPAMNQGILGLGFLTENKDKLLPILKPFLDRDTYWCAHLERLLGKVLAADCGTPVAIYATFIDQYLEIKVAIASSLSAIGDTSGSDKLYSEQLHGDNKLCGAKAVALFKREAYQEALTSIITQLESQNVKIMNPILASDFDVFNMFDK